MATATEYQDAMRALSDLQRAAINEKLSGRHPSDAEAMRAAGYAERSCKNPAQVYGSPKVALALKLGTELAQQATDFDANALLDDLVEQYLANPVDMLDPLTFKAKKPADWPRGLQRRVKKLKFDALGNVEDVTFEGTATLAELVGKHRAVLAFAQVTVEERVFHIVDYTGGTDHGNDANDEGERVVEGRRIDGDDRRAEGPDGADAGGPATGGALPDAAGR